MNHYKASFHTEPKQTIVQGQKVTLRAQIMEVGNRGTRAEGLLEGSKLDPFTFNWSVTQNGNLVKTDFEPTGTAGEAHWTPTSSGDFEVKLEVRGPSESFDFAKTISIDAPSASIAPSGDPITVRLAPAASAQTDHDGLFQSIRESAANLDFKHYKRFIDRVMCSEAGELNADDQEQLNALSARRTSVFTSSDTYQRLKVATELFLMLGVRVLDKETFKHFDAGAYKSRHGHAMSRTELQDQWAKFLKHADGIPLLPIDDLIRRKLNERVIESQNGAVNACVGLLREKLQQPCFLELIWSYWHEEGMLAQTMKAIAIRFQNQRSSERDPLASFDVTALYPLNGVLWTYVQEEQHRLTVQRRAYEYDHHYGITLEGKAVPKLRSIDSRSKFLEAFHNLLHASLLFLNQDDDTTRRADGFPVLNGLKEVHLLLREGMHNQFGDLPSTARIEMLMEQWILARPEMRDFLGGRPMMPYSEEWMERVDTMKKLQGWTDDSVTYFSNLAKFGEQLLLSIRHGNWSNIPNAAFGAHWAREFRPEIQQYVHNYHTVSGVDLSNGQADVRLAADRYIQPSELLRKRVAAQQQSASPAGFGSPRRADAVTNGRNGNSRTSRMRPAGAREEMDYSNEL